MSPVNRSRLGTRALVALAAAALALVPTTRTQFTLPQAEEVMAQEPAATPLALPPPRSEGRVSLEEALHERRSVREFSADALRLAEVAQLLWAAQGVTHGDGRRTAPSAGALYPLEVYLAAGRVEGLPAGIYRYLPGEHALAMIRSEDARAPLADAAWGQEFVRESPAVIAIVAVYERTAKKYGDRATRYVHMEVGSAAQNVYLEAAASGLGTVFVGAFDDGKVKKVLHLPPDEEPLCLLPVGRPR